MRHIDDGYRVRNSLPTAKRRELNQSKIARTELAKRLLTLLTLSGHSPYLPESIIVPSYLFQSLRDKELSRGRSEGDRRFSVRAYPHEVSARCRRRSFSLFVQAQRGLSDRMGRDWMVNTRAKGNQSVTFHAPNGAL